MLEGLNSAAAGMAAQQQRLDAVANDLANASTTGYKKVRVGFRDLVYTQTGRGSAQGPMTGAGSAAVDAGRGFSQGSVQRTDQPLDVAIQGNGFFQVQMPDGSSAYTRAGTFQVNSQGQLVTASGFPLQPALTMPANTLSITISRDGTVSAQRQGTTGPTQIGNLQLTGFMNPAGLQSVGENLYIETAASGTPGANAPGTNGMGLLSQGYVETSNVNVVEELVGMIQTQRAYEINSKAIQASDQMLQKLAQL